MSQPWTIEDVLKRPMAGAETEIAEEAPDAEANALGEAKSTVIEPGGTNNSSEFETNTDESTNTTVIVEAPPPAPEAPVETHCEHCTAHEATIAALETRIAELEREEVVEDAALAEALANPPEEAPPPEETTQEEEIAPRPGGFSRFWYGRLGRREEV